MVDINTMVATCHALNCSPAKGELILPYGFVSADKLLDDFLADVATWKGR